MKYATILAGLALAPALYGQGIKTTEGSYLAGTAGSDFTFEPIVTVGDRLPLTPGTGPAGATDFAFCGIPDAMGIYKDKISNQNILFVAHEMPDTALSRPFAGATRYKGAWVSRFVMGNDGGILSGSVAHQNLFLETTLAATRPPQEGDAAAFTRFCSGSFAGTEHGLDRPFFLTNEESSSGMYDSRGSQSVAIVDGAMHTLPALGRVVRETTIVQPRRDSLTVIVSTEDGPVSPNVVSYVYMYVGTKQRRGTNVLDKNGLVGGKVYVMAGLNAQHNEGSFTTGSTPVRWVEIPNAASLTASQISTQSDALGGFGFVRVEDAEFDPTQPTRSMFFTTTGGSGPNPLGRLYEVTFNPTNPIANGTLTVVYNASDVITPGGAYTGAPGKLIAANGAPAGALGSYSGGNINAGVDSPVSMDNLAVSGDFIVVCEDRNSPADAVFSKYGRNGGVWTFDRDNGYAAKLQSTFNYAYAQSRDSGVAPTYTTPNTPGLWETSGVINTESVFGPGTFVINVQGHLQNANYMRSNAPDGAGGVLTKAQAVASFVEDGQVLLMKPAQ